AEPQRRQQVQVRGIGPTVPRADPDEDLLGAGLRIFDEHVEVAVVVEDARVEQLVLMLQPRARSVRVDEIGIRKRRLRILVEVLHVRMRRRAIEVEVALLDVFAVIPFVVGEAEQALLQNRIAAVPQRQGEAEELPVVGDAGESVFTPPVRTGPCLVVTEIAPGISALAVVFADGAPLALAQIGTPLLPVRFAVAGLPQPGFFGVARRVHSRSTGIICAYPLLYACGDCAMIRVLVGTRARLIALLVVVAAAGLGLWRTAGARHPR